MKKLFVTFLFGIIALACSNDTTTNTGPSTMPTPKILTGPPALDDEVAVFDTDYGTFKIALYTDAAPQHVENFKKLIREKVYDGLGFHRVIPDGIIQGGDPQTRGGGNRELWGQGDKNLPKVPAEFSNRPFGRGSVGMARSGDPNSASSQFFICLGPEPQWDGKYTVFGVVTQGLSNVQVISRVPLQPGTQDQVRDLPVIKRAYLEKRQQ